jgi:hypothetical protein
LEVPFYAVTGIPDTNTTVYLTYAKLSEKFLYMDSSLTVTDTNALYIYDHIGNLVYTDPSQLTLTLTPRSINVFVVINPVEDAVGYRLTYQEIGGTELTFESRFTELTKNINPLLPETTYQIRLYADYGSGAGFVLVELSTTTTLSDVVSNYDMSDFVQDEGVFDFTDIIDSSADAISPILNSLFTTGDNVKVSLEDSTVVEANFVNIGDSVDITDEDTLLIPFDESSGSGQQISITLSDSSVVILTYDETLETVTLNGETYPIGSSFIVDGKKLTIWKL